MIVVLAVKFQLNIRAEPFVQKTVAKSEIKKEGRLQVNKIAGPSGEDMWAGANQGSLTWLASSTIQQLKREGE